MFEFSLTVAVYLCSLPTVLHIARRRNRVPPRRSWAFLVLRHLGLFAATTLAVLVAAAVSQSPLWALVVGNLLQVIYLYRLKKWSGAGHLVTAFLISSYVTLFSFLFTGFAFKVVGSLQG